MTARGSGHIVNVVSHGGLAPSDPMSLPYDTGHAALAVFSEGLARQLQGTGIGVSIFCPGAKGPRIGQNTRSRGVGRLFSGPDKGPDASQQLEDLASALIDGLQPPRFLILGDPSEAKSLQGRWGHLEARPVTR
jgi:NAD(P)-dependent dehydrogenase (short-subunit alcohol dehydrogenase family)